MPPWGWSTKRSLALAQHHVAVDRHGFEHGRIKRRSFKGIGEALAKPAQRFRARMERHRAAQMVRNLPKIVDAMAMVGMVVGDDHPIDRGDVR